MDDFSKHLLTGPEQNRNKPEEPLGKKDLYIRFVFHRIDVRYYNLNR